MEFSKFLSKVIGLYLVIVGIAMLTNMHEFLKLVTGLVNNAELMFVVSFITLILGLLMVVAHNVWEWSWRLLITFISWITLLKGASILLYPQYIDLTTVLYVNNLLIAYISASFNFLMGILLCYFGFKR